MRPFFAPWTCCLPLAALALVLDFSAAESERRRESLRRTLTGAVDEFRRTGRLVDQLEAAAGEPVRRANSLPGQVTAGLGAEYDRAKHLASDLPMPPSPEALAATLAHDLEIAGYLLGLERRGLGEIDDPEHRTHPSDNRPVASWWQRLSRRIFP